MPAPPPHSISLTRTIHPVGQGAFYSELFSDERYSEPLLTAVYDCGGYDTQLKQQIDTIQQLGIVFISHFHNDHIKGLQYLLEKNPYAYVILPAVSHYRFVVDLIYNYLHTGSISSASIMFMLSVVPYLSEKATTNGSLQIGRVAKNGLKTAKRIITVPSGGHFCVYTSFHWIYDAFYNEENISKEKELIKSLSDIIPSLKAVSLDNDDYRDPSWYRNFLLPELSAVASRQIEITRIFADIFGDSHNSYSMVVHSHSEKNVVKNSDCLFTGDTESSATHEALFRKILPHPHYIQVPHHGSDKNHNPNYYFRRQIAFMSVGYNNGLHHPGGKTVMDLTKICPYIHITTEYLKTKFKKKIIVQ